LWLSYDQRKMIIHDTWLQRKVSIVPFLVEVGPFHAATKDFLFNNKKELEWNIKYHSEHEDFTDFNIPNIKPNLGIGIIAEAMGCKSVPNNKADPWIKPIINNNNINTVYYLKPVNVENNYIFKKAFSRIDFMQSNCNLPLRLVNIPSPLVTASLVWDYTSFIEATLLNKKEVHYLLEIVTDITIKYIKYQLKIIKNLFTMGHEPWYIPRDIGIRVSDDTAAVMSPNTYSEFGVPYLNKISRAFNGLIWHSCGTIEHVLPRVLEIKDLRGIDIVMTQNNWSKIKNIALNKVVINMRHYFYDHENKQDDLYKYSIELINYFGKRGVLLMTSDEDTNSAKELASKLKDFLAK